MNLGEQIHAPHGFEALESGIVYHFMLSDEACNRAVLVTFGAPIDLRLTSTTTSVSGKPVPVLRYLQRSRFEEALRSGLIVTCPTQRELPHWLGDVTIKELLLHDRLDHQRRRPHSQRIDTVLAHMWPALQRLHEILRADSPAAELNRMARDCEPPQHESRYRTAFFAYVCFGMQRLALHYSIASIGKWDRAAKGKKFGRQSVLGAWHGHSSCASEVNQMCIDGFRQFSAPSQSMRAIYRKTVTKVFGCVTSTDHELKKRFNHPGGKPFPTYGQFAYRVNQAFDLQTRQLLKYGAARVRSKLSPSQGQFTDAVGNLMEVLQEDAYFVDEVSEGYLEGSHLPRLCVVRIICLASGMIVGIGFSLKGERAEAYQMAKACMAVDKLWFCNLFGITITEDEWPSIGLPLHEVTDRGPGATGGADSADEGLRPMIKEVAPSYSGQSKANVETRHPKAVKFEGAPQYKVTRLTIAQLAQREIWKLIESNLTTNVQSRLGPDAMHVGVLPTPIGLWNYLSRLGRTFAYRIPPEQAVRGFFTSTDLTVNDGAVYFMGYRYWSKALRDSSLLENNNVIVQGYMLPTCVRHIILDAPEGLLTVDAAYGIRTGDEESFLSVAELEQLAQLRSREQAYLRLHREAAKAEVAARFESETGLPYDKVELRAGRAKRGNARSMEEAQQIMPLLRAGGGRK